MKITIEAHTPRSFGPPSKSTVTVEELDALTVEDAIRLCENALSAHFGYGIKIHDYETYICGERDEHT